MFWLTLSLDAASTETIDRLTTATSHLTITLAKMGCTMTALAETATAAIGVMAEAAEELRVFVEHAATLAARIEELIAAKSGDLSSEEESKISADLDIAVSALKVTIAAAKEALPTPQDHQQASA